jgi:hypothetical protein
MEHVFRFGSGIVCVMAVLVGACSSGPDSDPTGASGEALGAPAKPHEALTPPERPAPPTPPTPPAPPPSGSGSSGSTCHICANGNSYSCPPNDCKVVNGTVPTACTPSGPCN